MAGGCSDAESSGSGAPRPLFRPLKSGTEADAGPSAKLRRSLDQFLDASALPDAPSSDDDAQSRVRLASASNAEAAGEDGKAKGALAKMNARLRKKKAAAAAGVEGTDNPRAKRAKARLERMDLVDQTNENPSLEDSTAFLEQMESDGAADIDAPKEGGRSKCGKKRRLLKRKPATKGGQMQVRMEGSVVKKAPARQLSGGTPGSGSADTITPAKEARLRVKGGGNKAAAKAKQKDEGDGLGSESEDEENPDTEAWEKDLASRIDKEHPEVAATAFSIKQCPVTAIRQLPVESYLGRRRLEEGGQLLMDTGGFINVNFMLGTYKNLQNLRKRQQRGDKTASAAEKADIKYLRWLIVKALKLRVINKRELRTGKVNQARLKAAEKSLRWSLARKANLADFSDNEGADEITPELRFKGKEQAKDFKAVQKEGRQNMRTQILQKQAQVSTSSSHNIDMEEMQNRLTAPSLSFDWEEKGSDEEEDAMLEVDMPEENKVLSKRDTFRDQLQRSASFHMAKGLTRSKTNFNLNKSFSAENLGAAPSGLLRIASAPASLEAQGIADANVTSNASAATSVAGTEKKPVVSKLWDMLDEPGVSEEKLAQHDEALSLTAKVSDTPAVSSTDVPSEAAKPQESDKATQSASSSIPVVQPEPDSLEKFLSQDLDKGPPADSSSHNTEAPAASEKRSIKPESSHPLSQDWRGVTPTQRWTYEADSRDSFDSILTAEEKPAAKSLGDKPDDISPTMAFVPSKGADEPKDIRRPASKAPAGQCEEISATAPFVPTKVLDDQSFGISPTAPFVSKDSGISPTAPFVAKDVEISPTAAFVAKDPVQISQTQPFVAAAPKAVEISQTQPFVVTDPKEQHKASEKQPVLASATPIHKAVVSSAPLVKPTLTPEAAPLTTAAPIRKPSDLALSEKPVPAAPSRSSKKSASQISEDSLSGSPSEDDDEDLGAEQNAKNAIKRKREREWLRHNRRAARQEAKDATAAKVKRAKVDDSIGLGVSLLSTQDRSRFQDVVDTVHVKAKPTNGRRETAEPMSTQDEADVFAFGAVLGGIQKKKSFLKM